MISTNATPMPTGTHQGWSGTDRGNKISSQNHHGHRSLLGGRPLSPQSNFVQKLTVDRPSIFCTRFYRAILRILPLLFNAKSTPTRCGSERSQEWTGPFFGRPGLRRECAAKVSV